MSDNDLLVLGASGFLGAHVARTAAQHVGVLAAARSAGPVLLESAQHIEWSAHDELGLERMLERPALRAVILCAALARGADCEARPAEARALNVELPARVAMRCAERGLRFVHVSTDLVFGAERPTGQGFLEEHSTTPLGVYAKTKRAGELAVLEHHPAAIVVRLPLLFGDSFGRGLGASDSLLHALSAGREVGLFVDEFRTPLDVFEAAEALVELAFGERRGLLHVAGPTRLSRYELGQLVLAAAAWDPARGVPTPTRSAELESQSPRPADASLNSSKARGVLHSVLSSPSAALSSRPPRS